MVCIKAACKCAVSHDVFMCVSHSFIHENRAASVLQQQQWLNCKIRNWRAWISVLICIVMKEITEGEFVSEINRSVNHLGSFVFIFTQTSASSLMWHHLWPRLNGPDRRRGFHSNGPQTHTHLSKWNSSLELHTDSYVSWTHSRSRTESSDRHSCWSSRRISS